MAEHPEQNADQLPVEPSAGGLPLGDEPPIAPDDTQPRAPVAVPADEAAQDDLQARLAAEEPPLDPQADTAETPTWAPSRGRTVLLLMVMAGSVCMCLMLLAAAGVAGYRDGLATNDAKVTQTLATGIAAQYDMGVADLGEGRAELAADRFAWIVETLHAPPEFARDSALYLATARAVAAYTPTPMPTETPTPAPTVEPSITPTPEPTNAPSPTLSPLEDPEYLYNQAAMANMFTDYEEAIELLEALRALDPDYRAAETTAMLQEVLVNQARIYLRGQNEDGKDRLQRGVLLMNRAQEIAPITDPGWLLVVGDANFVQSYILARDYVNGGFYAEALPILEALCAQNCGWAYPNVNGVSVEDLLNRARQGTGQ